MNPEHSLSALILASGEDVPRKPPASVLEDALIICADGGGSLARKWQLRPDLIIGDLDSLPAEDQEFWAAQGVPFQTVPPRKDQTDLELAVEYALGRGAISISLVGAWGSRIDHALGNVEILYRLALQGVENHLITKGHVLSAFCASSKSQVRKGSIVSLVPLTPVVRGVKTRGLGYPLSGQDLYKGSTFTISNQAVSSEIEVSIAEGVLLLVLEQ